MDILLRNRGDIVGFGKYVLNPDTKKPTETIHGHHLKDFSNESEHLVAVHSVQIFTEFEEQLYPYKFKGFDDPPVVLGDLNVLEKSFKTIIAWDNHKIAPNPRPSLATLGSLPKAVSVDILHHIRESFSKSPVKVRFARDFESSEEDIHRVKRRRIERAGNRGALQGQPSTTLAIPESLADINKNNDDEEEKRFENETAENFMSNHGLGSSLDKIGFTHSSRTSEFTEDCESILSNEKYAEIQSQILNGRFDESIDQFAEQKKSEEEMEKMIHEQRDSAVRSNSRFDNRTRCESRRHDGDVPSSVEQSRHTTPVYRHFSITGRIVKRLRENQGELRVPAQVGPSSRNMGTRRNNSQQSELVRDFRQNENLSEPSTSTEVNEIEEIEIREASEGGGERILNGGIRRAWIGGSTRHMAQNSLLTVQPSLFHNPHETVRDCVLNKRQYRFKTRQRAQKKKVSGLKAARREMVKKTFHENPFNHPRPCCNSGCFYLVDPDYAVVQYRRFLQMDREDRKRALKAMYVPSAGAFWFGGAYVCTRFLAKGFQFSNQLQCAVKGTPKARASSSIIALPRSNMKETKKNQIILYLRDLSERIGDSLPTKPHRNLPIMSKKQVFERFETFNRNKEGRESPSLSYWCDIWKKFCSDIKTHRRHGFTVCDTCEKIRGSFEEAENERVEATLRKELAAHYDFVDTERRDYEHRRDLSKRYPTKYLSLIVDGADQTSYGLPHFVFATKEDRGEKMQMKIIGVLEHGMHKQLTLLTLTDNFESGANHVIEALHRVLARTKAKRGKLPPTLFVQADNCTRENKNRFLMSYLELLVRKGVFEEVQLCFLPIGHTHADIDQAFSSVAIRLKLERAITDLDLIDLLRKCYNPRAYAENMEEIANFSGLCVLTGCTRNVMGFSPFRFFRITRKASATGVVEREMDEFLTTCDVKIQSTDQWAPLDNSSERAGFLKFAPDLRKTPMTDTTPPDNVLEVNKHIRSCEHRVNSVEKMKRLEDLRDRIYTRKKLRFHWDLSTAFEETGDYRTGNNMENDTGMQSSVVANSTNEGRDEPHLVNMSYSLNYFLAVKTAPECPDPFWIARTLHVIDSDEEGNALSLKVRWYQAKDSGDAFTSTYRMSTYIRDGACALFDDIVDVRSILCEFASLTRRGALHIRTQKAIRQTLNMH